MVKVGILGGGMAGLEVAVSLASSPGMDIEIVEPGLTYRAGRIGWKTGASPDEQHVKNWNSTGGDRSYSYPRLGGRSRYYQGVMLPVEAESLIAWPADLRAVLTGDGEGSYAEVIRDLESRFPEMQDRPLVEAAHTLGLTHVPQAASWDPATHLFRVYSPVAEVLRLARAGAVTVIPGAAHKLIRQPSGLWSVEVRTGAESCIRENFDVCILSASAIGNVQILAETFGQIVTTTLTDHFSVGAFVRLHRGASLGASRHPRLWTGYRHLPALSCNLFVQEMQPLPSGDRMLDINAVIEQASGPADYSILSVVPERPAAPQYTHVDTRISAADTDRIRLARAAISDFAAAISDGDVIESGSVEDGNYEQCLALAENDALRPFTSVLYPYQFAYGAFEHESSTTPAGADGAAVTTSALEVANLPGVFAVGPGTYPRPGAANPALTTLATSRMVAAHIRERYA